MKFSRRAIRNSSGQPNKTAVEAQSTVVRTSITARDGNELPAHFLSAYQLARLRGIAHNPAMRGIISIVIGAVMVIGGLSGKLVMRGTESGVALAVLGGVVIVIGLFRLKSSG
jgi:hypothetical protein